MGAPTNDAKANAVKPQQRCGRQIASPTVAGEKRDEKRYFLQNAWRFTKKVPMPFYDIGTNIHIRGTTRFQSLRSALFAYKHTRRIW